jgi:hypothetical protein
VGWGGVGWGGVGWGIGGGTGCWGIGGGIENYCRTVISPLDYYAILGPEYPEWCLYKCKGYGSVSLALRRPQIYAAKGHKLKLPS